MPVRALGSLLLSLSVVLSACSQASEPDAVPPPGASDAATGEEADDLGKAHGKGKMTQKQKARARRRGGRDEPAGAGSGSASSSRRPLRDRSDQGDQVAVDSASRSDPSGDGDRQGDTPSYADIRRAGVVGRAGSVRFTIRVDGSIPKAGTGEGVDMTASFHFRMGNGDEHQIYAIGSNSGWRADLDNSGRFPGRFVLDGDTFVFELSWRRLGGAAPMKWLAQTSWTRAADGPLDETEFAFDQVPEYGKASYPE